VTCRRSVVAFAAIEEGSASVVFASPEALSSEMWLATLKAYRHRVCLLAFDEATLKAYRHRVCLLAFDEAHCMSEW